MFDRSQKFLVRHRDFIVHVATMMSGKSIAAAIGLLATPVIARLFDPGDFGVMAAFTSIVSISCNVSSLRYETAIVLPKHEEDALALRALTYHVAFAFALILYVVIGGLKGTGSSVAVLELLGTWVWLVPAAVFLATSVHIEENWLTRKRSFNRISTSLVIASATTSGSRIGLGAILGSSVYALMTGYILGTVARVLYQRSAVSKVARLAFKRKGVVSSKRVAARYMDFPKLNMPAGLVFSLGSNLPVLLFGVMFSPAAAGLFAMANRLAKVPTAIVAASMRRVFLQKAAAIHNRGDSLRKAFFLATGGLVLIGILPLIGLMMFGQPMFTWLLGEQWREAGRYLEIIAPWMFMIWIMAPANPVFVVLRKQKFWLGLTTTLTILRFSAFGLAYALQESIEWTLYAFVVATIIGNFVTMLITIALIEREPRDPTKKSEPNVHISDLASSSP